MKAINDEPNWAICPFNKEGNKVKLKPYLNKIKVFPGRSGSPGVLLGRWINKVKLGKNYRDMYKESI